MHYVVAYYPQDISWVINSLLVFQTMSRENPDNEGFFMCFKPDSTHIVWQYVSKKDDPSLYERYNPLSGMETSSIFIVNAKSRKKQREQVKEIFSYAYQKLEQHNVVSISDRGKAIYVSNFFKP